MKLAAVWMLAAMLVGPPTQAEDPPVSEPMPADTKPAELTVKIEVPAKVTIGELGEAKVLITGDGREIDWSFEPAIPGKVFNSGRTKCYFTTSREGVYTIDVAVAGKTAGIARARAKVEMAYADGVKAKPKPLVMKSSDPAEDIRQWASEIQTSTRDQDVADLTTALNRSGSVSEAKGVFTTLAGTRAPAWNPIFPKFEALLEKLESKGKLGPTEGFTKEDHIRGALQSTAKALEAGQ